MSLLVTLVPARNEVATVGDVVSGFANAARLAYDGDCQIVVIDDASTDGTGTEAARAGATVVRREQATGLADCFRFGVGVALDLGADTIAHVDADGQYSPEDLGPLLERFRAAGGLVVGNRLHRHPDGMSELRYVWNVRLSELIGQLAGVGLADSQSGFRIFGADTARITLSATYTYTQEQIIRVARAGVPVTQLPIAFGPRLDGRSRLIRSPAHYLSRVFADLDSLLEEMGIDSENL